ncbi:MAG TPA: hypothetical protein DEH78_27240 [Solibacterales bacterium]|nr:hypothetical protein [Bryobacterales bacterium]
MWQIYDFQKKSRSVIQTWLDDEEISKSGRGKLNQKLDMLRQLGPDLPPKVLAGPLSSRDRKLKSKNTYKLIIHAEKMLRPFLCKGPIDNENEYTMLMGAIEKGGRLDHDPAEAEDIRLQVIEDPGRRMPNERYR